MVTVPLPVEYGPVPEEEERAPGLSEDPSTGGPPLLEPGLQEGKRETTDPALQPGHAPKAQPNPALTAQTHPHSHQAPPPGPASAAKPHPSQQGAEMGGHVNLGFSQGQASEKGKPTNLWNPTYGSWFLQQQQRLAGGPLGGPMGGRAPGEGQEQHPHAGRTVGEVAGGGGPGGLQHKQLQQLQQLQLQQQGGHCRPLLPPPAPPGTSSSSSSSTPLLLDSAALPPVPLYRLRRFPCGTVGYGYQEQGLPLESGATPPPPPPPPPAPSGPQRPPAVGRAGVADENRPLLVTMGTATLQDPRLPKIEGHNATVL